jgi:hypothetical protein
MGWRRRWWFRRVAVTRGAQPTGLSLLIGESVGYAPRGAEAAAALSPALTHPTAQGARKKPGAVSRPGTLREFQFPEYSDLRFVSMVIVGW